jgi:hypothetical protein
VNVKLKDGSSIEVGEANWETKASAVKGWLQDHGYVTEAVIPKSLSATPVSLTAIETEVGLSFLVEI